MLQGGSAPDARRVTSPMRGCHIGMSPDHRMMDLSRRTTKTLFVVAGLYVAIGLIVSASAAFAGDRLSTFLGFLIITGALAAGVMMHAILRLTVRLAGLGDRLDQVADRMQRIEQKLEAAELAPVRPAAEPAVQTVDLSAMGSGDPSVLTAATLERTRYPRLVTIMETMAAPVGGADGSGGAVVGSGFPAGIRGGSPQPAFDETEMLRFQAEAAVTTRNLLREWRMGMRSGDLEACRRIFSALVDTTDTATVLPLSQQLQELTERTEARLRGEFAKAVRDRDFACALGVGDQLCRLMPDLPTTREFEALRPHLLRKLNGATAISAHS